MVLVVLVSSLQQYLEEGNGLRVPSQDRAGDEFCCSRCSAREFANFERR